jgi:hypothetical protein
MKFIKFAILAFVLLSSAVKADEWSTVEKYKQGAVIALFALDMGQTLDIKNHPDQHETNPILGEHPSDKRIYSYFITAAILHTVLADALPTRQRGWLQDGTIALEVVVIGSNKSLGLKIKF